MVVYDDCVGWYDGVEAKTRNRQVGVHGDGKKAGESGKKLAGFEYWIWLGTCLWLDWPVNIYRELLACQIDRVLLTY